MIRPLTYAAFATVLFVASVSSSVSSNAATRPAPSGYVALGDSVAAGFGLAAGSMTAPEDRICKRSSEGYPHLVGEILGSGVLQLACSGAKFDEGLYGPQRIQGIPLPEQIARAFEPATPERLSITIGANDMRWAYFVSKCYVSRCGTDADKALFRLLRLDMRFEQWRMRAEIKYRSLLNNTAEPRTVLTGYYNPFGPANCSATRGITSAEKRWIRTRVTAINRELERAAGLESWLTYAAVNQSFTGHRLCSPAPWVTNPGSNGKLHATAEGQQAYADVVGALLR